jgi:AraC-like DNA-binding protein
MDTLLGRIHGAVVAPGSDQDPLESLLAALSVRLQAFAVCEVSVGWRLVFEPMPVMTVHYVLHGEGTLKTGDGSEVSYDPGSIIIAPAGLSKSFGDDGCLGETQGLENCTVLDRGLVKFASGGAGGIGSLMVCGMLCAGGDGDLGLFGHLQAPIVERFGGDDTLPRIFRLLLDELATPGIGSQAIIEALMKQCFVLLLRRKLQRAEIDTPLFAVLRDRRMVRAVAAVLNQPSAPHTVESLAAAAGMSRSPFAERFAQVFGQTPIDFVQKVRLRMGAQLLETTELPVKTIAASVGYMSRSYFSRAFRSAYGLDPTKYRTSVTDLLGRRE